MADVIKLRTDTLFNIKMLAEELKAGLMSNFICEEPSCCGNAVLLCFEQYYVRVSNFVSLSVMISQLPPAAFTNPAISLQILFTSSSP